MTSHWETHLYTFAVMLTCGDKIRPENLAGVRAKALRHGHTEGQCRGVEADPMAFIRDGFTGLAVVQKAITMRRMIDAGVSPNAAHRAMIDVGQKIRKEGQT